MSASATTTPHFNLDYLLPEQAQKHVTLNDALRRLDGLVQLSVVARNATSPPDTPSNGARYLIGDKAKGAWAGQDGRLALFEDTGWHFFTPQAGWRVWDAAEKALLIFDGTDWRGVSAPNAAASVIAQTTHDVDLTQQAEVVIPSHRIFLGLTGIVLSPIAGPQSWDIGVADGLTRFANGLPLDGDTEIRSPADPSLIYWQPTPLVLTPRGGRFTAGRIRLSLFSVNMPLSPRG
ncbi:MAG: DUF2793 domain-containing protein [Parvibaculales bacterium]